MVDLLGEPLETSTQALASVARKHSLWAQMVADGASGSGICALEGCNRARQYEVGCACDRCCERCGATEGDEHDQWCDEKAETEEMMSVEEGSRNARSSPAAAEEGDTTAATRAAAAAAQETDVCSVCQYRGRKLKHT